MQTRYISGTSAAYDLEKFQPKRMRVKRPTLVVAKPSQKARAHARMASALKVTAVLAVLASIVIVMLYARAMLTELNQDIAQQTTRLAQLQSEQTRLTAELESKISLRNIEEMATQNMGMAPVTKDQITYLDLSEGDKIELTSESPKQTLVERVKVAISNVKAVLPED